MKYEWTAGDAAEWERLMSHPVARKGIEIIKRQMRPKGGTTPLISNVDYQALFAASAARYEGRQEIIDKIEELGSGGFKKAIPLPEPFSHIQPKNELDDNE